MITEGKVVPTMGSFLRPNLLSPQIEYRQGVPKAREMLRTSPYMHKEEV
jgi:hypothetical protein